MGDGEASGSRHWPLRYLHSTVLSGALKPSLACHSHSWASEPGVDSGGDWRTVIDPGLLPSCGAPPGMTRPALAGVLINVTVSSNPALASASWQLSQDHPSCALPDTVLTEAQLSSSGPKFAICSGWLCVLSEVTSEGQGRHLHISHSVCRTGWGSHQKVSCFPGISSAERSVGP